MERAPASAGATSNRSAPGSRHRRTRLMCSPGALLPAPPLTPPAFSEPAAAAAAANDNSVDDDAGADAAAAHTAALVR
jgi:hypothetical protein